MSKKKVPFKMAPKPAHPQQGELSSVEPNGAQPDPRSTHGVDQWVMRDEPIRAAEPRRVGVIDPAPAPAVATRVVIDLTTERTWFELVRLVCVFPYMAVCFWTWNAMGKWLGEYSPKG